MLKHCFFIISFGLLLLIPLTSALLCYECKDCDDISSCTCGQLVDKKSKEYYCTLSRESDSSGYNIDIKPVPRNFTTFYVYDPSYVYVQESIVYDSKTNQWSSVSNQITYACQADRCNQADLLRQFPTKGLSLNLPRDWLNTNLQRPLNMNMTFCHHCPDEVLCSDADTEYDIDTSKCNGKECQGSCAITELFREAESEPFCYQSICYDQAFVPSKIDISAIYYLNKKQFEIVEINVYCNAEDCTDLLLFKDIKEKLQKDLEVLRPFPATTVPNNHANSVVPSMTFALAFLLHIFSRVWTGSFHSRKNKTWLQQISLVVFFLEYTNGNSAGTEHGQRDCQDFHQWGQNVTSATDRIEKISLANFSEVDCSVCSLTFYCSIC